MARTLRTRLSLWYIGTLGMVLLLFSAGVYFFVSSTLRERLDANLSFTLQTASAELVRRAAEFTSSSQLEPSAGGLPLADALDPPHFPGQIVAVVDADGRVLARKPTSSGFALRLPVLPLRASGRPEFYELSESRPDANDSCRGIYQVARIGSAGHSGIIVVTASTEALSDHLDTLQNVLALAIVLALLLAGSGGWLLAGHSLSPLAAMASATEHITANNLDNRLPVGRRDELGRFAASFNDLLSRLNMSFSHQRQFMADASHELRTPLSIVRTAAQVTLQKPERPGSEYREALGVIDQQAGRLSRIVEDMFVLARADMNQLPLEASKFYLDEVLGETARAYDILAQRKGVRLSLHEMREAPYHGDERLIRQMISNLLDNAVKFTPEGGAIDLTLHQDTAAYQITVTDNGCGIPDDLQPRVFERFFRADKARAGMNGVGGTGLGLAIARSIAEAHRGQLTLQHSGPAGSTFCITLPILGQNRPLD